MAKRNIVKVPDPILYKKCRVVEKFDERLWTLLDDMKETLIEANGAGLAAPQVAVLKRACIVDTEDGFLSLSIPSSRQQAASKQGLKAACPCQRSTAMCQDR